METAVEDLQEEYEALLEHAGFGVLILDSLGVIERANPMAHHLFGARPFSLMGRALSDVAHWDELRALMEEAHGQTVARNEIRVPEPEGASLRILISPIPGKSRARVRYLLLAHDVTELRRLETIRRDFVANVSHELRTPLASIRAMAETLVEGALEDVNVADRFLGTIIAETQRLTRISEDLLILSNAESGAPQKAPLDLAALMREVVSRFQAQAEKAEIALTMVLPDRLDVVANLDQIEQVVVNLVDNALKYTAAGGSVHVTADRAEHHVSVHIADTGIGIGKEDLPRIFERFYRVDKARSRQSGGTGLGLSIVKHIVESHGGQVSVDSERGRGSTFTFVLPAGK